MWIVELYWTLLNQLLSLPVFKWGFLSFARVFPFHDALRHRAAGLSGEVIWPDVLWRSAQLGLLPEVGLNSLLQNDPKDEALEATWDSAGLHEIPWDFVWDCGHFARAAGWYLWFIGWTSQNKRLLEFKSLSRDNMHNLGGLSNFLKHSTSRTCFWKM